MAVYLFILVYKDTKFLYSYWANYTVNPSVSKQLFLRKFWSTSLSFTFLSSHQPYKIPVCAGIDLVHDQVEQALLSEVENLRACQDRLKNIHERTVDQVGGKMLY